MLAAGSANAFSLLGPYADWMQVGNGFRLPGDIGGPMNLGEEYRWNVPVVTYAFDQSFLDYFGSNGVAAVESAIQVFNDLPPASEMVLTNFPLEAAWYNYPALSAHLHDLKTATLALLVEQLGLGEPQRSIFVLRQWHPVFINFAVEFNWPPWAIPDYITERNFDPETIATSHSVNGHLFTGQVAQGYGYDLAFGYEDAYYALTTDVFEYLIDPLQNYLSAVGDWRRRVASPYLSGLYFTGELTQDDVGGLRYLLRSNNVNLEMLLPGTRGIGTNANFYVDLALRPGVEKITFVRQLYDSLLGQAVPLTNQFTDSYFTNGILTHQQLERVVTQPDILFSAADTSGSDPFPPPFTRTGTSNWWNSSTIVGGTNLGPGIIRPPIKIIFARRSPLVQTFDYSSQVKVYDYRWASFDGSTNAPIIYPDNFVVGNSNQLTVHLWLHKAYDFAAETHFTWQLPSPIGTQVALQASTNLADWATVVTFTNQDGEVIWNHGRLQSSRFFRVVPQ